MSTYRVAGYFVFPPTFDVHERLRFADKQFPEYWFGQDERAMLIATVDERETAELMKEMLEEAYLGPDELGVEVVLRIEEAGR